MCPFFVRSRSEDAPPVLRMHLRGHGREGENPFDSQLLRIFHQLAAEKIFAERRLGLAEKDYDVVLVVGVGPKKEAIARPAARLNDSVFDFDVIHVEQIVRFIFRDHVHP